MTRDRLDPALLELLPELALFAPPAAIEDKTVMSVWHGSLHSTLQGKGVSAIIVSGAETEVCVLATVMGAIDLGYRVVLVRDAICSGANSTHDAMTGIFESRFGMQLEMVNTEELQTAKLDRML